MLNQAILTGNMGGDPEVLYSSEGNPVATFSLAFRSSKKKTGWIKVVCFGRLAEVTEKYLHKGARVGIIGTLGIVARARVMGLIDRAESVIRRLRETGLYASDDVIARLLREVGEQPLRPVAKLALRDKV